MKTSLTSRAAGHYRDSELVSGHQVNLSYFDLNVGVLYNGSTDGNNNYYLGASAYHILQPTESFTGNNLYTLSPPFHGSWRLFISRYPRRIITILFTSVGLYSRQANAVDAMLGGAWSYNLTVKKKTGIRLNLYLGVWARFSNLTDAIIPYVGLDVGSFYHWHVV
ncbi:MAG: hypothetical protein WDM78_09750 [Puia sp.]